MECWIIGDRWEIGKKISYGGYGEVYAGRDMENGEEVAAKFEDASHDNLLTEYKAYNLLNETAGIPKSYYYGSIAQYNVLILELMGKTVEEILNEDQPIPFRQAISFAKQLLQTMQHVHLNGIVHFDVKPSNIMTGTGVKNDIIHIVDFGAARIYDKEDIENNKTIKYFQQLDKDNLFSVILDLLRGSPHNINDKATSI